MVAGHRRLIRHVIDPDGKIEKAKVENFWMCDAMEVFIDTLNTKESRRGAGAGQQFWCWPFGSLEDAAEFIGDMLPPAVS